MNPCPRHADMQGLQLSLALIRLTEPFLIHADPLLESFLNMESKLPGLDAS